MLKKRTAPCLTSSSYSTTWDDNCTLVSPAARGYGDDWLKNLYFAASVGAFKYQHNLL